MFVASIVPFCGNAQQQDKSAVEQLQKLNRFYRMLKSIKFLTADKRAFVGHFFSRNKSRTVSPHKTRDIGSDNISVNLLLESTKHGIIKKCTALYNNVFAEFIRISGTDYFVKSVFDNTY